MHPFHVKRPKTTSEKMVSVYFIVVFLHTNAIIHAVFLKISTFLLNFRQNKLFSEPYLGVAMTL